MASLTGVHPFSCKFCPRSFSDLARYHGHRKQHNSRYLKHWLRKKPRTTNKRHSKFRPNHFEEPVFQQKLYVYVRGGIKVKSITVNEEQKELLYSCGTCNRTFSAEIHLKRHERQAHSRAPQTDSDNSMADKRKFRCKYCNKTHHNKADLDYHERSAHTGETLTYTCDVCKSTFKRKVYLNRHMRIHNDIRPYVCKICGKSFIKGGGLKEHERTHTGEKPYKCSTCLRGFSGRANLRRHEMTHSGEQPFECEVCGKRCNRIASLRQHMRIHTGERPYNCMHCNKAFPTCANLRRHERTHLEKKQFSCRQCGKEFVQKYTLKLHEMNHLGIRPHLCLLCGKTFMEKRKLRMHLTATHNISQTDESENGSQQYELDLANIDGGSSINNIPEHLRSKAMEAIEGAHFKSLEDFQAYWKATYLENGSESVGGSGVTESDLMAKQVQSINNFQQIVKNLPPSTPDQQPQVPNQQQTPQDKHLDMLNQQQSILNQSQSILNQQMSIFNQPTRMLPQQSRIQNHQPNLQDLQMGMPNQDPSNLAQQDIEKLPLIPADKLPEALIELAKIDAAKQFEKRAAKKAKKAAKKREKEASKQAALNRVVDSLHVKSHIDSAQEANAVPQSITPDTNGEIQQSKRPRMMPSYVEIPKEDNTNSLSYGQTQSRPIVQNKQIGQSGGSSIFNKFNTMSGAESFDCIQCGQTFTSQIVLEIHMKTHQREECQSFCIQCNISFSNILDLEDHIKTHDASKSNLEGSTTDDLMTQSQPEAFKSFCAQCNMTFEKMTDLEEHIKGHNPLLQQTPESTMSKGNLPNHILSSSGFSSAPDDSDCVLEATEMRPIQTSVPKISDGKKRKVREYPCTVCDKVYRKKQSLKTHMLTHEIGIVPIECVSNVGNVAQSSSEVSKLDVVSKVFKNADDTQDMAYESSNPLTNDPDILITGDGNVETITTQNVEGDNLSLPAIQLGYMKEFSSSQIKKKIWPCKFCNEKFPIQQLLAGHMNKHRHDKLNRSQIEEEEDNEEKPFSCHICHKAFNRQERLAGHMNKHKDLEHAKIPTKAEAILRLEEFNKEDPDNQWRCPYCEDKFDEHDLAVEHVHVHTESRAPFTCEVCYKGFNKKANYQTHMITHTTELKHVCETCNKAFKHVQSLRKHVQRCRTIFHCEQCDETFTQKRLLNSHMWNTHHKEDTCKCKVCGKIMASSSGLREHELIHSGEKPYQCHVCTRGFVNRSNLRRHIMIHENDRPFKCNFCEMTFNRLASLQQHERCHTGEKPFKCSQCDICFTSKSTRRKHEKRHTNQKTIKCKFCDKTFWDNYTCRTHERVHLGDLPYECNLCNKKYSERHVLKKHMKTSHKEWYAINMENQDSTDMDDESALLNESGEQDDLGDINLEPDIHLEPLSEDDDDDDEDRLLQPLSDEEDDEDRVLQPLSDGDDGDDDGERDDYNMAMETDEEQDQGVVPQSVNMVTDG